MSLMLVASTFILHASRGSTMHAPSIFFLYSPALVPGQSPCMTAVMDESCVVVLKNEGANPVVDISVKWDPLRTSASQVALSDTSIMRGPLFLLQIAPVKGTLALVVSKESLPSQKWKRHPVKQSSPWTDVDTNRNTTGITSRIRFMLSTSEIEMNWEEGV